MIRGPDVSHRQCRSAQIRVWIEQLPENWPGCLVALQVQSANAAGTVVEFEIGVELFIFRLELVARTTGLVLRYAHFPSEVSGHLSVRTQCSLLLRAPQTNADGAPRPQL